MKYGEAQIQVLKASDLSEAASGKNSVAFTTDSLGQYVIHVTLLKKCSSASLWAKR
jgi:hypothetical protein